MIPKPRTMPPVAAVRSHFPSRAVAPAVAAGSAVTIVVLAGAKLGMAALVLALPAAFLGALTQRRVEQRQQGLTILFDRRRYLREVWAVQFAGWLFRFTAFWFLLEAFNVGGSVQNVLLVLGVNAVAAVVPFSPGGAVVQQALLVKVFAGTATGATIAAYSVGQQIAIAVWTLGIGFVALVWIFRFRSFKEVIAAGREHREEEKAASRGVRAGV